jgi:hypothetical protein
MMDNRNHFSYRNSIRLTKITNIFFVKYSLAHYYQPRIIEIDLFRIYIDTSEKLIAILNIAKNSDNTLLK